MIARAQVAVKQQNHSTASKNYDLLGRGEYVFIMTFEFLGDDIQGLLLDQAKF